MLQRTPDTFPSYLNDIAQSMMEYVADISRERVRFRARRLRAHAAGRVAARQQGRVLHQDRQALRLERSRHLHAARHSGRHVHHVAGHVVPLVGGHARQAGSHAVQARRRRRHSAALAVLATGTDEMAARVLSDNLGRGLVAHGRVAHEGARLHGRRDGRRGAHDRRTRKRASPSSIRPRSRRAWCARRACCGRTSPRARRRRRRSSR